MSVARAFYAVRISVEIGAVAWVTAWGLHAASGPSRWVLAGTCAGLLLTCWGRYVAPKSPNRLDDPARLAVEITVFAAVAITAAHVMSPAVGAGFGALAIVDALGLRVVEAHHSTPTSEHPPANREGS